MSDDNRMERAKRIRQMREGRRGDESGDDPDTEDSSTAEQDAADTGDADAGGDGDVAPSEESPSSTDSDSGPEDDTAAKAQEPDSGPEADGTAAPEPAGEDQEPPGGSASETDEQAEQLSTGDESVAGADTSLESGGEARAELPDAEEMEAALADTEETTGDEEGLAGPAAGVAEEVTETTQEADTRVLEFVLGDEQYGLDIEYIEEIVKHDAITRVPNTEEFVEGVVDLRGQITTILNPKVTIGKDDRTAGNLIIVFDSDAFDDQNVGWVVDDVRQVSPVRESDVNDPPMEEQYINGVIDRDDEGEFVIWTSPEMALEPGT